MQPTQNDVLSGRGACFNQHPGNKHFRRMLDAQMDSYTKGTKKKKMVISHAIVDAIYSMEPPGRFLKKCDNNTIWRELSRKEASNKAAQAMAYAVRAEIKLKPILPSAASSQPAQDQQQVPLYVNFPNERNSESTASASAASRQWGEGNNADDDDDAGHNNQLGYNELFPDNPSLQQQLHQMQQKHSQSNPASFPSNSGLTAQSLARAHLLSQAQIQQQQYRQQQQNQLRRQYLMGQHALQPQPRFPPIQTLSAPGTIPQNMDFLRQEFLIRSNYGTGAQPSSSAQQHQRNVNNYGTGAQPSSSAQQHQRNVNNFGTGAQSSSSAQQHQRNVNAASNNCMPNLSMFGAANAPQQGAQLLNQEQRAAMLRNLLAAPSYAAPDRQPSQSQSMSLPQRQIELLQRNLQSQNPQQIDSVDEVVVELRDADIP
eukprot:CAMPEP_0113391540 /NCGR_PEP_ID=MMETSP0013_2-20120614/10773_1 /TAXON_ID=2843 ORGANISM="Skeletonema costatum, Strain 1716" /NCGR_SAMPLE_ID=MMETSP0013_2 /ASSEMBLY_ACC=CAM_ASM_000158 /LENGTH=427 /DNA_ID=CAMNT_0000274807 /DNA_START=21 /DNA_END=1301 /DNA_ORIENTATION=+ /assembly_acc=CAM_ASM_000158